MSSESIVLQVNVTQCRVPIVRIVMKVLKYQIMSRVLSVELKEKAWQGKS